MSDVNVPLLRKAVEWVESQDKLADKGGWDQALYLNSAELNDAMYAAHAAGYAASSDDLSAAYWEAFDRVLAKELVGFSVCDTKACVAGHVVSMYSDDFMDFTKRWAHGESNFKREATEMLGISNEQATYLFHGENSAAMVRQIAERIAGEPL